MFHLFLKITKKSNPRFANLCFAKSEHVLQIQSKFYKIPSMLEIQSSLVHVLQYALYKAIGSAFLTTGQLLSYLYDFCFSKVLRILDETF